MAEAILDHSGAAPAQSEIRRSWYIKSMQSERVKVLVGSTKDTFEVPYDLLAQYSTAFKRLRNALNDSGDEISLPDVTKPTFEDFFIWLHAYEPTILLTDSSQSIDAALHLAVFAERYQIYHLRNQASDVVRSALRETQWNITPDMISAVYKVAPAKSALRQLSFLGFVAAEGRTDSTVWQAAFITCPDLGWDYFQFKNGSEQYSDGIEAGGACRFHDHGDIHGWVPQDTSECPYPFGVPRQVSGGVYLETPVPIPDVSHVTENPAPPSVSSPPPVVVNGSRPVMPSVAEVVEPEPEEVNPSESVVPEFSVDQPSDVGCWASETTETEPVELEPSKFEPTDAPLAEESVESWVTKTKEAHPVEVESVPTDEETSFASVGNARMAMVNLDEHGAVSKVTLTTRPEAEEKTKFKEAPVVEIPESSPVLEEAAVVPDLSVVMQRADSVMSVNDPLSPSNSKNAKKNKGKKGRRQSQI